MPARPCEFGSGIAVLAHRRDFASLHVGAVMVAMVMPRRKNQDHHNECFLKVLNSWGLCQIAGDLPELRCGASPYILR
jgi:hypothetical protein